MKKLVKCGILQDTRDERDVKIKARGIWGGIKSVYELKPETIGLIPLDPNDINDFCVQISVPSSSDQFDDYLPSMP
jgi:hypothetical protein